STAQQLQETLPEAWKWHGRNVFIADGSHVSMPDTKENQTAYPQPVVQQEGIGFPLARLAVLLSLASGACCELAIAPYAGKGTGETTLLRQMYDALQPGDVALADALFDNFFVACELVSAASSWSCESRRSAWAARPCRAGRRATSSSGQGRASRAA